MSFELKIKLEPPAEQVADRVARFPERMMARMVSVLDTQNDLTVGHIQLTRLSQRGPQTLGVVDNRLRPSIRRAAATVDGLMVLSSIGSNVKYLGVHEFGFNGTVTVRSHERRFANVIGTATQFAGARRSISMRDAASLSRTKKKKIDLNLRQGVSRVSQHLRRMEFPERAPIRRGIEERVPDYRTAMSAAILEEWRAE